MDWTDVEMELGATGRDDLAEWCSGEVARLTKERDAAFSMSRCECASDEVCRNISALREALETIARVSDDQTIVTCAKRALTPNVELTGASRNGEASSPKGEVERLVMHGG